MRDYVALLLLLPVFLVLAAIAAAPIDWPRTLCRYAVCEQPLPTCTPAPAMSPSGGQGNPFGEGTP